MGFAVQLRLETRSHTVKTHWQRLCCRLSVICDLSVRTPVYFMMRINAY